VDTPADVIAAIADVFQWVGLVGAMLFALLALLTRLVDGTWLPARAVVEQIDDGRVVRWIDQDGGVNEAPLSAHDIARIGDRDMADIFSRRGWENRMRLTPRSPLVRVFTWLAIGLAALGVISFVGSLVLAAVAG